MATSDAQGGRLVLGVDGGATRTVGVLAAERGAEMRRAEGGPTNLH